MLDSIAVNFEVVFVGGVLIKCRVMGAPVDVGVVRGEGERSGVERIDMCSHSVLGPFGHDSFDFYLFLSHLLLPDLLLLVVTLWMVSLHDLVRNLGKRIL